MDTQDVVIVTARCQRSKKGYGIRFEKRESSQWFGTWAFTITEKAAEREGYNRTRLKGSFSLDSSYPGCPHCENPNFFKCSCGKIACWDGESQSVTCPWCNDTVILDGQIEGLDAGGDL